MGRCAVLHSTLGLVLDSEGLVLWIPQSFCSSSIDSGRPARFIPAGVPFPMLCQKRKINTDAKMCGKCGSFGSEAARRPGPKDRGGFCKVEEKSEMKRRKNFKTSWFSGEFFDTNREVFSDFWDNSFFFFCHLLICLRHRGWSF